MEVASAEASVETADHVGSKMRNDVDEIQYQRYHFAESATQRGVAEGGMTTRAFSGIEVLQAYTDRLLCDLGKMYELLSHAVGEDVSSDQIPRVIQKVKPWLEQWFPEVAAAGSEHNLGVLDDTLAKAVDDVDRGRRLGEWLKDVERSYRLQESYAVPQITMQETDRIDALEVLKRVGKPSGMVAPDR